MKRRKGLRVLAIIFAIILLCVSIMQDDSMAAIPEEINYQGYLTDSDGVPIEIPVTMVFSLYNVSTGGTALWSESQNVSVNNGIYSVILGTGTPIFGNLGTLAFDKQYYLGIRAGTDPEMTPRQPLTSVAYAFTADTALNVANNVITSPMIQDGTVSSADVNFNYAGSMSKGGLASELNCSVCVSKSELADSAVNSAKIQNGTILFNDIGGNSCTNGQVMKWGGTAWGCAIDVDTNTTYSAGTGLTLSGTQFTLSPLNIFDSSPRSGILSGTNSSTDDWSSGVVGIASAETDTVTREYMVRLTAPQEWASMASQEQTQVLPMGYMANLSAPQAEASMAMPIQAQALPMGCVAPANRQKVMADIL